MCKESTSNLKIDKTRKLVKTKQVKKCDNKIFKIKFNRLFLR